MEIDETARHLDSLREYLLRRIRFHEGKPPTKYSIKELEQDKLQLREVELEIYELGVLRLKPTPGCRLAAILRSLLTRKVYKRYVEPVIADMQEEYIVAMAMGDRWHARWITLRGHLLVIPGWLYAFGADKLGRFLRPAGNS